MAQCLHNGGASTGIGDANFVWKSPEEVPEHYWRLTIWWLNFQRTLTLATLLAPMVAIKGNEAVVALRSKAVRADVLAPPQPVIYGAPDFVVINRRQIRPMLEDSSPLLNAEIIKKYVMSLYSLFWCLRSGQCFVNWQMIRNCGIILKKRDRLCKIINDSAWRRSDGLITSYCVVQTIIMTQKIKAVTRKERSAEPLLSFDIAHHAAQLLCLQYNNISNTVPLPKSG